LQGKELAEKQNKKLQKKKKTRERTVEAPTEEKPGTGEK